MSVDAKHLVVVGPSGGGKTTHLRKLHAKHSGDSIFLTTKGNERKAQTSPPQRVRKSTCSYPQDIQKAREWAKKRDGLTQIIVDEAQNAPTFKNETSGVLYHGFREDREGRVKWVIATQNPMTLKDGEGYGTVQQAEYWVFVGKLKTWHVGFLNANRLGDMVDLMPTENYEYVVIDPSASLSPTDRIVYRGTTDPQYG